MSSTVRTNYGPQPKATPPYLVLMSSWVCFAYPEAFAGPWGSSFPEVSEKHRMRKVNWQHVTECNCTDSFGENGWLNTT